MYFDPSSQSFPGYPSLPTEFSRFYGPSRWDFYVIRIKFILLKLNMELGKSQFPDIFGIPGEFSGSFFCYLCSFFEILDWSFQVLWDLKWRYHHFRKEIRALPTIHLTRIWMATPKGRLLFIGQGEDPRKLHSHLLRLLSANACNRYNNYAAYWMIIRLLVKEQSFWTRAEEEGL